MPPKQDMPSIPTLSVVTKKPSTRDSVPLPAAVKRVIRNQKAQSSDTQRQSQSSSPKSTLAAVPEETDETQSHQLSPCKPKVPTLQDMYNTWRALEEHLGQMARLPRYIKQGRKACQRCRIQNRECDCFDYSTLEAGYLANDRAIRQGRQIMPSDLIPARRYTPFSKDDFSVKSFLPSPVSPMTNSSATMNTTAIKNVAGQPQQYRWVGQVGSRQPARRSEIDECGHPINDIFGIHPVQQPAASANFDFNDPVLRELKQEEEPETSSPALVSYHIVKAEIREIVMAREKIGTTSRRWCCVFGSNSKPGDPVCSRMDDNMETIRRHYGREHGKHRYFKKPGLRTRCGSCGHVVQLRAPNQCPHCHVVRGQWVREMFALIEVPVQRKPEATKQEYDMDRTFSPSPDAGSVPKSQSHRVSALQTSVSSTSANWAYSMAPSPSYHSPHPHHRQQRHQQLHQYQPQQQQQQQIVSSGGAVGGLTLAVPVNVSYPALMPSKTDSAPVSPTTPLSSATDYSDPFSAESVSMFPPAQPQQQTMFRDGLMASFVDNGGHSEAAGAARLDDGMTVGTDLTVQGPPSTTVQPASLTVMEDDRFQPDFGMPCSNISQFNPISGAEPHWNTHESDI